MGIIILNFIRICDAIYKQIVKAPIQWRLTCKVYTLHHTSDLIGNIIAFVFVYLSSYSNNRYQTIFIIKQNFSGCVITLPNMIKKETYHYIFVKEDFQWAHFKSTCLSLGDNLWFFASQVMNCYIFNYYFKKGIPPNRH